MAIERWRPWDELREMERRMEETMRYPLTLIRRPLIWWRVPAAELGWTPGVELYEKDDKFVVRAELPGMKKEEFDISVLGNTLTIKGERKAESEVKDEDYYRCELCYGKFSRSVALPAAVEAKKVEANYENGILEVTLPKAEEAKPKKVEVKVK
ncbi:MAG: Hsp20/alpha crystallin family protein [Dehalococcoidia bacterium]|nr:Hsp20/alpha crystallin family protein [Dehalococcoidia bacterium]